jgi:hypothetical protein
MTTNPTNLPSLFPLGQIVSTPGAWDALTAEGTNALEFLRRHVTGGRRGGRHRVCPVVGSAA